MQSESESRMDEMERDHLQKEISQVETALSVSTSASRAIFETFLTNARGRITVLEKKIKDSQVEREAHAREQVAISDLAQKEAALTAREKETYSGFLKEDFFTKKDFGRLEEFYKNTWDRLSEGGKDEMSHRVWEGIRRDEYKFSELPKPIQEKEAGRAYKRLHSSTIEAAVAERIPESDRNDFIRAYESGRKEEASVILERDSFKENLFRSEESSLRVHHAENRDRDNEQAAVAEKMAAAATRKKADPTPLSANNAALDMSSFKLDGVKMVEAKSQGSSAEIPNGHAVPLAQPGSTRGC